MPLEPASNVLDDATHVELDGEILNLKSTSYLLELSALQLCDLALLLGTITSWSSGCIDPKYKYTQDAMGLIQENEDLRVALAEAFKAKSFKSIRNLSTNPTSPTIFVLTRA
jgi:hypothetical protein